MKKFSSKLSSVVFMWIGFALSLVAVLSMFLPCAEWNGVKSMASLFWSEPGLHGFIGAWPCFVGYMLILVGGIMMAVMALPSFQPSVKTEKIVLISAICAVVVGIILVWCVNPFLKAFNNIDFLAGYYHTGMYFTLVLGLGSAAMSGIALALDWQ